MSWTRGGMLAALIVGVAIVAYFTVRTWLSDDGVDRTIAEAWARGVRELRYHGLPLDGLPIHLVLGAGCGEDEERLLRASGEYRCFFPSGRAGLTFAANSSRVCVSAGGVGLTAFARAALTENIHNWSPDYESPHLVHQDLSVTNCRATETDTLADTLHAVGWEPSPVDESIESSSEDGNTDRTACGVLSPPGTTTTQVQSIPLALLRNPLDVERAPLWSVAEASAAGHHLYQLANRLQNARRPLCPINRIIIAVPVAVLLGCAERISELQLAIRRDLEILQQTLRVDAPVTVLVSGLECHSGFIEFMRRAGPQTLQQQTLGQAVEVGSPATRLQLELLAINACGQVEDCIYAMLQQEAALARPGNTALYRLLCDLRTGIRQSLTELLIGAFSREGTEGARPSIAGCYFCANGSEPQHRGFVEAVWRLQDHGQEELDWSPAALERESFHRKLSRTGWIVTALLMLTWIGLIGTRWIQ